MIAWLISWFLRRLVARAGLYGKITLQQTDLESGTGWHCSIRARESSPRSPRYAWTATAATIPAALAAAVEAAKDNPIELIKGAAFAPKLGGDEFDPE